MAADQSNPTTIRRDRIAEAHRELARLVEELDSVELHHAAAHVSTALDIMRADYPELVTIR